MATPAFEYEVLCVHSSNGYAESKVLLTGNSKCLTIETSVDDAPHLRAEQIDELVTALLYWRDVVVKQQ